MLRRFTIAQTRDILGLDDSELRHLVLHFREFLSPAATAGEPLTSFSAEDHQVLRRVLDISRNEAIQDPETLRNRLKLELKGASKTGSCEGGILAFTSGRSGTGKSAVIWNLANALADRGYRCVVYDGSLSQGGICSLLSACTPPSATPSRWPWELHYGSGVTVVCGRQLLTALQEADAAGKADDIEQRLQQYDVVSDFILLDTGQGRPENALRYAMIATEMIEVTTPDVGANADSFAVIRMLNEIDSDIKVSLLVNRANSLGQARETFSRIEGAARKAAIHDVAGLGWIAEDEFLHNSLLDGKPVTETMPTSAGARCVNRLADFLVHRLVPVQTHATGAMAALAQAFRLSLERQHAGSLSGDSV